eukprot:TRINITY_DN123330_c0_g1_i1.p1 TRINITY_DN123330_c0_g1~~TRINITY_DN123330_c0_g1_i1.p1  ORF type:complete len:699 (+),score=183.45 TRINITY_DN123330_c0_g1_i1:90-2186(+)
MARLGESTTRQAITVGSAVCGAVAAAYAVQHLRRSRWHRLRAGKKSIVILGYGYSGGEIGRALIGAGAAEDAESEFRIVGSSRSGLPREDVRAGVEPIILGSADAAAAAKAVERLAQEIRGAHVIIATAPPGADKGDPFLVEPLLNDAIQDAARRGTLVIYLSSVGVYGDQAGKPVSEATPPAPKTVRAKRRLAAEEAWRSLPVKRLAVVRLPGIYGARRGPLEKAREGNERIVKEGHVFSRIHVDDIAGLCEKLIESASSPQRIAALFGGDEPVLLVNCCDSDPAPQHEVSALAYQLLGKKVPPAIPFEHAELSAMARSFYDESRLMTNQKFRDIVGSLKYDSYKTGLPACLAEEQRQLEKQAAAGVGAGRLLRRCGELGAALLAAPAALLRSSERDIIKVALIDNGSLRAEATLSLRRLAAAVQAKARVENPSVYVEAVSARFADRIPAKDLEGVPAKILPGWLDGLAAQKFSGKVLLLPLLIGPSNTLTQTMPSAGRAVPNLEVEISPSLVCQCPALYTQSATGADELADILHERLGALGKPPPGARKLATNGNSAAPTDASLHHVLICDHGSPVQRVTAAREGVRRCLEQKLGQKVLGVCMERRDGPEFDFNGSLLENVLVEMPQGATVSVALLFLQEGKHAGPGGDIAGIIAEAKEKRPDLHVETTSVMAGHEGLVDLLLLRMKKAIPLRLFP